MNKKVQRPLAALLLVSHTLVSCSKNPMADISPHPEPMPQVVKIYNDISSLEIEDRASSPINIPSTSCPSGERENQVYSIRSDKSSTILRLEDTLMADNQNLEGKLTSSTLGLIPPYYSHPSEYLCMPFRCVDTFSPSVESNYSLVHSVSEVLFMEDPLKNTKDILLEESITPEATQAKSPTHSFASLSSPKTSRSVSVKRQSIEQAKQPLVMLTQPRSSSLQQEQQLRLAQQAARTQRKVKKNNEEKIQQPISPFFTTQEGHQIQFTDSSCNQALINLNLPQPFKRSLTVAVKKQDSSLQLADILGRSKEWQVRNFHLYLPEKNPTGQGILYIGIEHKGLLGGMRKGGKEEERGRRCGHTRKSCKKIGQEGHAGYIPPRQESSSRETYTRSVQQVNVGYRSPRQGNNSWLSEALSNCQLRISSGPGTISQMEADRITRMIEDERERRAQLEREIQELQEAIQEEERRERMQEKEEEERARERVRMQKEIQIYAETLMRRIVQVYEHLDFKHSVLVGIGSSQYQSLANFIDAYVLLRENPLLAQEKIEQMKNLREEMADLVNKLKYQYQVSQAIYFSQQDLYFGADGCDFLELYRPKAVDQLQRLQKAIEKAEIRLNSTNSLINDLLPNKPILSSRPMEGGKKIINVYDDNELNTSKFYHDYLNYKHNKLRSNYSVLMSEHDEIGKAVDKLCTQQKQTPFTIEYLRKEREALCIRLENLAKKLKYQYLETHDLYFGLGAIKLFEKTIDPNLKYNFQNPYPYYSANIESIIAKYGKYPVEIDINQMLQVLKIPMIMNQLDVLAEAIETTDKQLTKLHELPLPMLSLKESIEARIREQIEKDRRAEQAKKDNKASLDLLVQTIEKIKIKNNPEAPLVMLFNNLKIAATSQNEERKEEIVIAEQKEEPKQQKKEPMKVSERGLRFIADHEGFYSSVKSDPSPKRYPTIGHGHKIKEGEVFKGKLSPRSGWKLLVEDAEGVAGQYIRRYVKPEISQEQFDALASFTFNLGPTVLWNSKKSGLLKDVNEQEYNKGEEGREKIRKDFRRYDKSDGLILKGLESRREHEANLFLNGIYWKKGE